MKELFPHVIRLKSAAPVLENWEIIAFRPRLDNYSKFKLNYAGIELDPLNIWTYHRVEEGFFDLVIHYPTYTLEQRDIFINAGYILLDMALGEFDVTTGIRFIDHQGLPEDPESQGLAKFSDLRDSFDSYIQNQKVIIN